MSPVSRPLFDWSEDPDDAEPRDVDADLEADTDADADPDDDESGDGADDDDADDADADDLADLDDEFPLGDGVAEDAVTVWCPYCGEPSEVAVDPGGGAQQSYVEDCPVCCRPWRVTVSYRPDGSADVWAQTDDE